MTNDIRSCLLGYIETALRVRLKGGKGSGFYGHVGRPGKRGGSAPKSGVGFGKRTVTESKHDNGEDNYIPTPIEKVMSSGKKSLSPGQARDSSTYTLVCDVEGDGRAILKGSDGGFANPKHEVTAYRISRMLGFDGLVPETVMISADKKLVQENRVWREGDNLSVQHWEENAFEFADYNSSDPTPDAIMQMTILDVVQGNQDRHHRNFLVRQDGSIAAIDNGSCWYDDDANTGMDYWREGMSMRGILNGGEDARLSPKYEQRIRRLYETSPVFTVAPLRVYLKRVYGESEGEAMFLKSKARVNDVILHRGSRRKIL